MIKSNCLIKNYQGIIIIVISSIFLCCNNENSKNNPIVLDIKLEDHNLKSLEANVKEIIPLETIPESTIGRVKKMFFFNNRIYVLDNHSAKTLFVFSKEGKFINKTVLGKGPGEIIWPYAFTINSYDSTLLVWDQMLGSLIIYDTLLNYLNKKQYNILIKDIFFLNRDSFLVFHHLSEMQKKENVYDTYALLDATTDTENSLNIYLRGDKISTDLFSPAFKRNDKILFVAPWNYRVYAFDHGQLNTEYILNFGKYNFSEKMLADLSSDGIKSFMAEGSKIGIIVSIFEFNDFFIIITFYKKRLYTVFHSINSNITYSFDNCIEHYEVPDCLIWGVYDEKLLYGLVEPDQLTKFTNANDKYKNFIVDPMNNPYFVLFETHIKN